MTYSSDVPDARGHFGTYGGRFVPEALVAALDELTAAYEKCRHDQAFQAELAGLHATYTGRPSPVTDARGSPSTPAAPGSCSSARTSTTPARTRSTMCWARPC